MRKGESLKTYAHCTAKTLHRGQKRRSGEPYIVHPESVARLTQDILLPGPLFEPGIAAAYLHDGPEDNPKEVSVLNPFNGKLQRSKRKVYLNDLLVHAGLDGQRTSYMVAKLTHRSGSYDAYFSRLCEFAQEGTERWQCDIGALIAKECDKHDNSSPHQVLDPRSELRPYRQLRGAPLEEVKAFLERKGVADAFDERGDYSFAPTFFLQARAASKEEKRKEKAECNILHWSLQVEEQLLMDTPARSSGAYDAEALRSLMLKTLCNDVRARAEPVWDVLTYYADQIPTTPGYRHLFIEIYEKTTAGGKLPF